MQQKGIFQLRRRWLTDWHFRCLKCIGKEEETKKFVSKDIWTVEHHCRLAFVWLIRLLPFLLLNFSFSTCIKNSIKQRFTSANSSLLIKAGWFFSLDTNENHLLILVNVSKSHHRSTAPCSMLEGGMTKPLPISAHLHKWHFPCLSSFSSLARFQSLLLKF